jgi:hypothetical protein
VELRIQCLTQTLCPGVLALNKRASIDGRISRICEAGSQGTQGLNRGDRRRSCAVPASVLVLTSEVSRVGEAESQGTHGRNRGDRSGHQVLDSDSSGGLSAKEFCMAIKKLVRGAYIYIYIYIYI